MWSIRAVPVGVSHSWVMRVSRWRWSSSVPTPNPSSRWDDVEAAGQADGAEVVADGGQCGVAGQAGGEPVAVGEFDAGDVVAGAGGGDGGGAVAGAEFEQAVRAGAGVPGDQVDAAVVAVGDGGLGGAPAQVPVRE